MPEYIKPELTILVFMLYGLGMIVKNTELIKDKYIPLTLTVVSVLLSSLYVIGASGFSAVNIFNIILS